MSEMAEAIRALIAEKGYTEESVKQTIENALKSAYKRTYGTSDNAIVKFAEDMSDVAIYSRKTVVDGVYDPVTEIELEEAQKLSDDVELGDEIDILEDPKSFDRSAVSTGKQTAHQGLNETIKDSLYNQYKDKVGEMINGYFQRERNGNIFVDLGNAGKLEGYLPVKFQSPRETYEQGDRIKAIIVDLKKTNSGLQIVLSRSDPRLVQIVMELEIPEIADGTVKIEKCVREAGYRTKMAVSTVREEIDPVGACVGTKGVRIQNVIRELLGEKIDVLRYDADPAVFIQNALSPAQVNRVVILDAEKKQALAIVDDSQFSLAIGKQGQNVRLANRLCDWNIDVKTEEQCAGMDFSDKATTLAARNLFKDELAEADEEITTVAELPGVSETSAEILKANGIEDIVKFIEAYDNKSVEQIEGLSKEEIESIYALIKENVEFVEEQEDAAGSEEHNEEPQEEEKYYCPECGAEITLDMTHCPKCGVEFEFTEDEE
ncbi:MAG: transcription termination factor NusA [Treponema porcinum]|uniref:transcription termination factor NusA n=1 Tax=Treponema porcinum TaxID=261392 RepID=UPI002352E05A|nr:transcription termination factor NusA [Treponema porcinum]MCI6180062.1 transcription termination factor NusA [Treponema porcinum]MCI6322991.1 transcription termination factor NusA [Treponema porcinum]MCI6815532.1 transcription termination factor NusA [Treponema porcinum]MCI7080394.1 transcription termination factor NusA [Treponema porcinum]MDY5047742.1 transcription termination factor NusA [Treponema porcinum]